MAMMRRIQSERPRAPHAARLSLPQHIDDAYTGMKNLMGRTTTTTDAVKRASLPIEERDAPFTSERSVNSRDARFDFGGNSRDSSDFQELGSLMTLHDRNNYAPKSVHQAPPFVEHEADRPMVSPRRPSVSPLSDDSFNEELSHQLASLRERIVSSHFQSVQLLLAERNRLRAEVANAETRRGSAQNAPARRMRRGSTSQSAPGNELTPTMYRPDLSQASSCYSYRPEGSTDVKKAAAGMRVSLMQEGEGPVVLAVSKNQRSPRDSRPESPTGSRLASEHSSRPGSAKSQEIQRSRRNSNSTSGQGSSKEAIDRIETDSLEMGPSFSLFGALEDPSDVKEEFKSPPMKKQPSPPGPEGTPEPPSNAPCALPCAKDGDSDIECSEQDMGEIVARGSVTFESDETDGKPDTNGIADQQKNVDRESSVASSATSDESLPEEKFELWGIWLRSKYTANRRQSFHVKQGAVDDVAIFGERTSKGENSSERHPSGSGSFLGGALPPAGIVLLEDTGDDSIRWRRSRRWISARLMLAPSSLTHILWEILGLLFIVYDAIVIPLETFDLPSSSILTAIAAGLCTFWLLDLIKQFFTGYIRNEGTIELDPVKVAQRYIRSWLVLDVSCTTCDCISLFMAEVPPPLEIARMFRMLRLISVAPEIEGLVTEHMMSMGNADIVNLISSVVKSIIALLAVAHLIACAWYAFGKLALDSAGTSWVLQHHVETKMLWERYAWSLHWSLGQFVGEYIFLPTCAIERGFSLFVLLFALLFSALFVSTITTAMTRLQILAGKQASQMAVLRRYLSDNNISASLTVRVLRNAEHSCHSSKKNVPEKRIDMLTMISEPLRVELHYEVHFPILAVHPWFSRYQLINPAGLRKVCHVAVKIQPLQRGDVIFSDCETPVWPRMFFVVSGSFTYLHEMYEDQTLHFGDWACEAVLWTRWMHCGTLSSGQDSVLASLDAEKFTSIVSPFPTDHAIVYGQRFVLELNTASRHMVSDLASERTEELVDFAYRAGNAIRGSMAGSLKGSLIKARNSASSVVHAVGNIRSSRSSGSRFSHSGVHQAMKGHGHGHSSRRNSQASRRSRDSRNSTASTCPVRKLKSETELPASFWESEA